MTNRDASSPSFPAPVPDDDRLHVYVSVGHQQMMTDAMRPLGWSMWQMIAARPMCEAGGRLFVDVTDQLASPVIRPALLAGLGASDPLIRDALETVLAAGGVEEAPVAVPAPPLGTTPLGTDPPAPLPTDPTIVAELIERIRASVDDARRALDGLAGPALFDALVDDVADLKRVLFDPRSMQAIVAGMEARQWLDTQCRERLGLVGAADTLSLAAPGNVTAEMGLALLDVADAIRPHPEVVDLLRRGGSDDAFVDELRTVVGGEAAPHPERLGGVESVGTAGGTDRARRADRLGGDDRRGVGVVEQSGAVAPARRVQPPPRRGRVCGAGHRSV